MTPKERLDEIGLTIRKLEAEQAAIYRASLLAPESEKVTNDDFARFLGGADEEPPLFIQYPVTVHGIEASVKPFEDMVRKSRRAVPGGPNVIVWVAVRPCGVAGRPSITYLGVYLGDIATRIGASLHRATGVLQLRVGGHNPAIWVPDLARIVYGYESWWGYLKKPEDLKQITDAQIDDVFYVRAFRELTAEANAPPGGEAEEGAP